MPLPTPSYYIFDQQHQLFLVAGDTYDGNVYHQPHGGRENAKWSLEPSAGGGFQLRDQKHGKYLVASDTYEGKVYHQEASGRANARWSLSRSFVMDGSEVETLFLIDHKHGKALLASHDADGQIYHGDAQGSSRARWTLIPTDSAGIPVYLYDSKHRLFLTAGDVTDGQLYHQAHQGRTNAIWMLQPTDNGSYLLWDLKHNRCLVAPDTYTGRLTHQDASGRLNARWILREFVDDREGTSYTLTDCKHGRCLLAGDASDGTIYHLDPQGRMNALWTIVPVENSGLLQEVQREISTTTHGYNFSIRSGAAASAAGYAQLGAAFVAYDTPQPGTIPIYRETPLANPGSGCRMASRSAAATAWANYQRNEVAFYAYAAQLPGTVPVYEEVADSKYHFSVRDAVQAAAVGWKQTGILFYAYPPDALKPPRRIALRCANGQYVHLEGNGITGVNVVAKRTTLAGAEPLYLIELEGNRIALLSSAGKPLTAEGGGGRELVANRTVVNIWETFVRHDRGNGAIGLQANSGQYVCAEGGGGQALVANRPGIGPWETFTVVELPAEVPEAEISWPALVELREKYERYKLTTVAGTLKYVSCGDDGTVLGITPTDAIVRWSGTAWEPVSGSLKQVSCASSTGIWGVNSIDDIYRKQADGSWENVPGSLMHVSLGADGTVWGANSAGQIFRRVGGWQWISGSLRQISVGSASQIYGVNSGGAIFKWTGAGWVQVPGSLKHVSVASDGTLLGVTADNELCRYDGSGTWQPIATHVQQVSVSSAERFWGTRPSGEVFIGGVGAGYRYVSAASLDPAEASQLSVAFVAYRDPQPGTVPIYEETPLGSAGSNTHYSHYSDAEASSLGFQRVGVAFHAFAWPAPGTIPVYRETKLGQYHFSTRSAAAATAAGFTQENIAFFAYPASMSLTGPKRLRCVSTQQVIGVEDGAVRLYPSTEQTDLTKLETRLEANLKVRLRSADQTALCVDGEGNFRAFNDADQDSDQLFTIVGVGAGQFRLRTLRNTYVWLSPGGARADTQHTLVKNGGWNGTAIFEWAP